MATGWYIWSTREHGVFSVSLRRVDRLPKGAVVSADGAWAELTDEKGVAKVFVKLTGKAELPRREKAA